MLALRVAGVYWAFAEEPERALEHTTEALALARGRPHVGDLAMALVGHATALIDLERLDEAEALLDEAAPLIPQLGASDVDRRRVLRRAGGGSRRLGARGAPLPCERAAT